MDKSRPDVKVVLDGKERTLRMDINAMAIFEETTGKSLLRDAVFSKEMSMKDLRALIWACLSNEDETVTEKQVGSWITIGNMLEVTTKLFKAFEVSIPEVDKDAEAVPLVEKSPSG